LSYNVENVLDGIGKDSKNDADTDLYNEETLKLLPDLLHQGDVFVSRNKDEDPLENVFMSPRKMESAHQGCIRVHMNIGRAIHVISGTRPPSMYDIINPDASLKSSLDTFLLPRNTMKNIYIDSETTADEVIKALLRKFRIVDDPKNFALYERTKSDDIGKEHLRLLTSEEKPLEMFYNVWSTTAGVPHKELVLQENDIRDIYWNAFSIPELENFVKMLNIEEEQYLNQIKEKYHNRTRTLKRAMESMQKLD